MRNLLHGWRKEIGNRAETSSSCFAGETFELGSEKQEESLLEWIANNEKHKSVQADVREFRIERYCRSRHQPCRLIHVLPKNAVSVILTPCYS